MVRVHILNASEIPFLPKQLDTDLVVNLKACSRAEATELAGVLPSMRSVHIHIEGLEIGAQRELFTHLMGMHGAKIVIDCKTFAPGVLYDYTYSSLHAQPLGPRILAVVGGPCDDWTLAMCSILRMKKSLECIYVYGEHASANMVHSFAQAISMNPFGVKKTLVLCRGTAQQCCNVATSLVWNYCFMDRKTGCVYLIVLRNATFVSQTTRNRFYRYDYFTKEQPSNTSLARVVFNSCDVDNASIEALAYTLSLDKTLVSICIDCVLDCVTPEAARRFAAGVEASNVAEVIVQSQLLLDSLATVAGVQCSLPATQSPQIVRQAAS